MPRSLFPPDGGTSEDWPPDYMQPRPEPAIKPTRRNGAVLLVLLTGAARLDGLTIASASGTGGGGVHVVLARLEALGWVTSDWEQGKPEGERRRFYRLTPDGRVYALRLLGLANPYGEDDDRG